MPGKMKFATMFFEIVFLISLSEGNSVGVNLTEEAANYISRLQQNITSWGLSDNYEYWTRKNDSTNKYPITARGHNLQCLDNSNIYGPEGKIVRLRIIFTITTPTCTFQGRINYAGYFAYYNRGFYHTVGVGNLENAQKELEMLADWYLEYFIHGVYEQRITVSV
ncbi:hypothetical protein MRX96_024057 [Rhipicephalus microplus]